MKLNSHKYQVGDGVVIVENAVQFAATIRTRHYGHDYADYTITLESGKSIIVKEDELFSQFNSDKLSRAISELVEL